MKRVALLTEDRFLGREASDDWYINQAVAEDRLLLDALAARGVRGEVVDWLDLHIDWGAYDAVVIRATWNYTEQPARFHAVLSEIADATRLVNPRDLVTWNLDKHYLAALGGRGVPIVPTRYVERGTATTLASVIAETGWDEVCIKPAVSAGARHTYRVSASQAAAGTLADTFAGLLRDEAWMVQPFQASVPLAGERTFMVFGGRCTHAVLKRPAGGDFRVQDDFGGSVAPHVVTSAERAFVEAAVAACPVAPVYARVDVVRGNDGRDALMELELVEPELFFRFEPSAADAMVEALLASR